MSRTTLPALLVAALLLPASALGHAAERMVILTLPTGHHFVGAALAVALTALAGAILPRLPRLRSRVLFRLPDRGPGTAASWIAFALWLALIAAGFLGSHDPLLNPLVLAVWIGLWVALPLLTLVFGNLWHDISPWRAPAAALRSALGLRGTLGLARLGHWPAVLGFAGFAWLEIASLAPADPEGLARIALAYFVLVLLLATLEGPGWLEDGEAFTLYFRLLARIAPLWSDRRDGHRAILAGLPGTQVLTLPPLGPGGFAFVTLVLAAVSFDGLSESFLWLANLGLNPLEFPGRSAVVTANSLGLFAFWAGLAALIAATLAAGWHLDGRPGPFRAEARRATLALLPISAGYHAAHYLVALLTTGQYALMAANDPFERGWRLLGLPSNWVSFAFLSDPNAVATVWNLQVALITAAHLIAVILGLRLAGRASRPLANLPLTLLMVLLTLFGLWLLSTPTGT